MDYRAIMRSQTEIGTAAARNSGQPRPRRAARAGCGRADGGAQFTRAEG